METTSTPVATSTFTEEREIQFDTNIRQRFEQYSNLIVIFVIALVLILGLLIARYQYDLAWPVINITIVVIVMAAFLGICYLWSDLSSRDPTNYDEYAQNNVPLNVPVQPTADEMTTLISGAGSGSCTGAQCCDSLAGTVWSSSLNSCVNSFSPSASAPAVLIPESISPMPYTPPYYLIPPPSLATPSSSPLPGTLTPPSSAPAPSPAPAPAPAP